MKKNYIVSKANNLITSKYKLSLQEQRIILALVSMIDSKNHTKFHEYEMTTKEFAELLNVENTNHTYFKKITKQIHWLSICTYYKGTGKIKLELHSELIPYLLQLKEQFTTYYLSNVLQMKSKYSIRLYEVLKAQQFKKRFEIEIDKLRDMLGAEKYDRYSNLNQKILKPAITEVNRQTDIFVHHIPHKQGSKVISIEFEIISKRKIEQELYGGE
jgi:plasmid replication initiation protein